MCEQVKSDLTLRGQTLPTIRDPSWDLIEVALLSLSADANLFLILDAGDCFVQTSGSLDSLVIEWCTSGDGGRVQYQLARKGAAAKLSDESVRLVELDVTDALICFEAFYKHRRLPKHYHLVDITKEAYRPASE